jgi:hypothetical protein
MVVSAADHFARHLILLALIGRNSPEIADKRLPPFERVVSVASLSFLVWGFTPLFREKSFAGTVLLAVNTVFAFIFFFLAVYQGSSGDFNGSGWDIFFVGWQWLLAVFGVVNCASKLDDERTFAFSGLATLALGPLLHSFNPTIPRRMSLS